MTVSGTFLAVFGFGNDIANRPDQRCFSDVSIVLGYPVFWWKEAAERGHGRRVNDERLSGGRSLVVNIQREAMDVSFESGESIWCRDRMRRPLS